jgi:hypothetical protein
MKTEQILEYTENRAKELIIDFKKERDLMNQWETGNPFHEYHRYFMCRNSGKLNEVKDILDFLTGGEKSFYEIYNSIQLNNRAGNRP